MRRFSKLLSSLLVVALLISTAACNAGGADSKEGTHKVIDHLGVEVTVPNDINTVVVCDILPLPSVLTVFFNSGHKIVGMADTSMVAAENGLLGQLYPEILNAETGFIKGTDVNIEELIKLQPDVVFYGASQPEIGEQLRNAGFAAVAVSVSKWEYDSIKTLNQWIALLSEIFPDSDKAEIVQTYSNDVYNMIQGRVSKISEADRQEAFFLFKYSDTTLVTSGDKFFGQWWAEAIGAKNVSKELTVDNQAQVNMEQVYAWNPSLIFITNFTTAMPEDLYNNKIGTYDWSEIDAVKNHSVYKMPLGMYRSFTPGVDTPITLLWLAKTAYPQQFADIDINKEAKDYYKEVFGVVLTDKQVSSIFAPPAAASKGFGN